MPAINLKDFFCRYTTDKFIAVRGNPEYPNHLCSVGFIPLEELTKAGTA